MKTTAPQRGTVAGSSARCSSGCCSARCRRGRRRLARAGGAGGVDGRRAVARRAQDDGHAADHRVAGHRDRRRRRRGARRRDRAGGRSCGSSSVLTGSAIFGALVMTAAARHCSRLPEEAAEALRAGLAGGRCQRRPARRCRRAPTSSERHPDQLDRRRGRRTRSCRWWCSPLLFAFAVTRIEPERSSASSPISSRRSAKRCWC